MASTSTGLCPGPKLGDLPLGSVPCHLCTVSQQPAAQAEDCSYQQQSRSRAHPVWSCHVEEQKLFRRFLRPKKRQRAVLRHNCAHSIRRMPQHRLRRPRTSAGVWGAQHRQCKLSECELRWQSSVSMPAWRAGPVQASNIGFATGHADKYQTAWLVT